MSEKLTDAEREAVRQAQLDYWRKIPWASGLIDRDAEFEAGEKDIWHNGEGRSMCAAVERILADRDAATAEALRELNALADDWSRRAADVREAMPSTQGWAVAENYDRGAAEIRAALAPRAGDTHTGEEA